MSSKLGVFAMGPAGHGRTSPVLTAKSCMTGCTSLPTLLENAVAGRAQ